MARYIIMRSSSNLGGFNVLVMMVLAIAVMKSRVVDGYYGYGDGSSYSRSPGAPVYKPSTAWLDAHATFYGDETASETMG